jgi:signal transduction histidine kinase
MALQIDRGDYRTLIDPTRIRQVLNNLIGNAIKYSPRGGDIQVRLYREDRRLVVSVSDQGIGIAAHEIGSVFEPFKRSQNVQHSTPGLGLGLSICRQILRAHYGDIEIQSLPGKGTTVSFWLPLSLDLAAGKESQASL